MGRGGPQGAKWGTLMGYLGGIGGSYGALLQVWGRFGAVGK